MRSPPHRTIHLDNASWGKLDALLREHYPVAPDTPPPSTLSTLSCIYCDPLCTDAGVCDECAELLRALSLITVHPQP